MYKISIIVPVYNAEKFLHKCINSIVNQSFTNIEILLINDGSTDNSLDICYRYANIDNRIIVLNKENGGVASARNLGLDNANGDFIGFVDSDDYLHQDMYSKLIEAIQETDACIVECGYYKVVADNKIPIAVQMKEEIIEGHYESSLRYISQQNIQNFLWNKLYKQNLFESIRIPDLRYSEDFIANINLHFKCERKTVISDCLYYYVKHKDSVVNKKFSNYHYDNIKAGEMALEFYKNRFSGSLVNYVYINLLLRIRSLYLLMSASDYNKEDAKVLKSKYKQYFKEIKNKLYNTLSRYKHKNKIFISIIFFRISPRVYSLLYSLTHK